MKVEIGVTTTFFKAHLRPFEDDIRVWVSRLPWILGALSWALRTSNYTFLTK